MILPDPSSIDPQHVDSTVAFVLFRYPLGPSSMLISAARSFAEDGSKVNILVDSDTLQKSPIDFSTPNVRVLGVELKPIEKVIAWTIERAKRVFSRLVKCFNGPARGPSQSNVTRLSLFTSRPALFFFMKHLRRHSMIQDADVVVGIEPEGIYLATQVSNPTAKCVYFNMELTLESESQTPKERFTLSLERNALVHTDLTVIQNESRRASFLLQNSVPKDRVQVIPVTSYGPSIVDRSDHFRRKFGISPEKTIVLYAGNIIPWAMCSEIVDTVKSWPDEFVLVLHTWRKNIAHRPYFKSLVANAIPGRVFFSTDPVDHEELPRLLSSADIGLMLYKDQGLNFSEIGFSSNKLAEYTRVGLPVICNDLPSMTKVLTEHGCGLTVSADLGNLSDVLCEISQNYDEMRANSLRMYDNHLRFENYFANLVEALRDEQAVN